MEDILKKIETANATENDDSPEPEEETTSEFDEGYSVGYSDAITDMRGLLKKLEHNKMDISK